MVKTYVPDDVPKELIQSRDKLMADIKVFEEVVSDESYPLLTAWGIFAILLIHVLYSNSSRSFNLLKVLLSEIKR